VISLISTNISSKGLLYTDSNGRDMQTRKRNYRPSWALNTSASTFNEAAGNYYPLNAVATISESLACFVLHGLSSIVKHINTYEYEIF
jgi:hypothetical protein